MFDSERSRLVEAFAFRFWAWDTVKLQANIKATVKHGKTQTKGRIIPFQALEGPWTVKDLLNHVLSRWTNKNLCNSWFGVTWRKRARKTGRAFQEVGGCPTWLGHSRPQRQQTNQPGIETSRTYSFLIHHSNIVPKLRGFTRPSNRAGYGTPNYYYWSQIRFSCKVILFFLRLILGERSCVSHEWRKHENNERDSDCVETEKYHRFLRRGKPISSVFWSRSKECNTFSNIQLNPAISNSVISNYPLSQTE